MRLAIALLALVLLPQAQAPRYSVVQDGEAHGDPPYLLEDGWTPLLNGSDLTGWRACETGAKSEWYTTRFVRYERILGPTQLSGRAGASGVILNGPTGRTANLCTDRAFGDIELYLDFMIAKGSNSGVYLQGLYEMQIFDSWGSTEEMTTSDAGAIYHQWIDNRGVAGSAPRINAARRPGEWQTLPGLVPGAAIRRRWQEDATSTVPSRAPERPADTERHRRRGPDPRGADRPGGARAAADAARGSRPGGVSQYSRAPAPPADRAVDCLKSFHHEAHEGLEDSIETLLTEDLRGLVRFVVKRYETSDGISRIGRSAIRR